MATPNLSYQNKFTTTLSSGVAAPDTTIPLTSLPTPNEGYLILEPDSSTAWEEIYYTSKTGSAVVCPSAALGRGLGGSTAASHSSGATVRMDSSAELFSTLQDATALTGLHRYGTDGVWFDFVGSGCVWTGDSLGSTLAASMTSGIVYINGRRHTVVAVTSRAFTASKDTYIDLLYSTTNNIATPVYTEVANNAASPALASNSVRIGIIITGGTTIAAAGSINQGQETAVLPIASSIPYAVTDSLGNLICPRDPNRRIIGFRQSTSVQGSITTVTDITGMTMVVNVPAGRKIKFAAHGLTVSSAANDIFQLSVKEGATQLTAGFTASPSNATSVGVHVADYVVTASAGAHTYKLTGERAAGSGTNSFVATSTIPATFSVELV